MELVNTVLHVGDEHQNPDFLKPWVERRFSPVVQRKLLDPRRSHQQVDVCGHGSRPLIQVKP